MFFDPDKDEPTEISQKTFDRDVTEFLRDAGAPPAVIYAYKKTGLILVAEHREDYPPEVMAEYDAAIEEYPALERAGKLGTRIRPICLAVGGRPAAVTGSGIGQGEFLMGRLRAYLEDSFPQRLMVDWTPTWLRGLCHWDHDESRERSA